MKKKKFDVNKLNNKKVDLLAVDLGERVRDICDTAAEEINEILSSYGMKAKIAIAFEPLEPSEAETNLNSNDANPEKIA